MLELTSKTENRMDDFRKLHKNSSELDHDTIYSFLKNVFYYCHIKILISYLTEMQLSLLKANNSEATGPTMDVIDKQYENSRKYLHAIYDGKWDKPIAIDDDDDGNSDDMAICLRSIKYTKLLKIFYFEFDKYEKTLISNFYSFVNFNIERHVKNDDDDEVKQAKRVLFDLTLVNCSNGEIGSMLFRIKNSVTNKYLRCQDHAQAFTTG